MAPRPPSYSRRSILANSLCTATAVAATRRLAAGTLPSERIQVALIGAGTRGFYLLDEVLKRTDCEVVAICDVDEFHYRDRDWGKGPALGRKAAAERVATVSARGAATNTVKSLQLTDDYREVVARDDVDAVLIATPDHWHALCTADAILAGKDVYCEKPVTHLFSEGRTIADLCRRHSTVFQVGSQQRSDSLFRRAAELIRNQVPGTLQRVEVGLPPGYDRPQGSTKVTPVPDHLNHSMWCGPSPRLSFMQARHHRWWRGHRAYGGGVLMDWIGHHNDIAHWAMNCDQSGPVEVEAVGWSFPQTMIYNTPHQYTIRCNYAGGVQSTISSTHQLGTKFLCSNGWVHVTRGRITASDERWLKSDFQPGQIQLEQSGNHMANFLQCVRSRGRCIAPAETGHRSITPGHLGYVSAQLGKPLRWDPQTETVVDNQTADRILKEVRYESPWQLPHA